MDKPVFAVRVRDDAHARIAWALGSHPGIGKVAMLGRKPPASWRDLVVGGRELGTADIVVDPDPDDAGIVVTAGDSTRPGITNASPQGLARALQTRLTGDSVAIWTTRGKPNREGPVHHFPPPVGPVRGTSGDAPIEGDLAGVGAFGDVGSVVVIDDLRFLETVCMAAGAVVADIAITEPTPVWERAEDYIRACEQLGLVIAESVSS
jgi:hypothetical protein